MDEFVHKLIEHLNLRQLVGEGGMFCESYQSNRRVSLPGYPSERAVGSAIYYLLTEDADSFSALHRLRGDELYHFYLGDPAEMLQLLPGGESRRVVLGPSILAGQQVQLVVPGGAWQGSRLVAGGRFALLGTTMSPGFDTQDFEAGSRGALQSEYPELSELIRSLTREE
jgi:predicted cupin superfamily sugar epimerase